MTDYSAYQTMYQAQAAQAAQSAGVPVPIFLSLIGAESGWNPFAVGSAGEIGLTQMKPSTANDLNANAYDPVSNLQAGATYLAQQFATFGNWTDALRAYNAGPTGAANNPGVSSAYATNILNGATALGYTPTPGQTTATGSNLMDLASGLFGMLSGSPILGATQAANGALGIAGTVAPVTNGVASSVASFSQIFTAQFWQNSAWYLAGGVVIIALLWNGSTALFEGGKK